MPDFAARARTFVRAVRQMPNNVAAVRRELETPPSQPESVADRVGADEPDYARTRRLDELALGLAVPREITTGVAVATVTESDHHRLVTIADGLRDVLGRPVRPVLLAPGTGPNVETSLEVGSAEIVVVRTPSALGWIRAVHVLVHASPAEETFLLHPGAVPELDTLAEMLRVMTDTSLAVGTVIGEVHGTRQLAAPSTICLVRTQAARDLLARTYLRTAMSTSLDALIARSGRTVRVVPRVAGSVQYSR